MSPVRQKLRSKRVPECFRATIRADGRVSFEAKRSDGYLVSVSPDDDAGLYVASLDRMVPQDDDADLIPVDATGPIPLWNAMEWAEQASDPALRAVLTAARQ